VDRNGLREDLAVYVGLEVFQTLCEISRGAEIDQHCAVPLEPQILEPAGEARGLRHAAEDGGVKQLERETGMSEDRRVAVIREEHGRHVGGGAYLTLDPGDSSLHALIVEAEKRDEE
jgi:hypothetical protein